MFRAAQARFEALPRSQIYAALQNHPEAAGLRPIAIEIKIQPFTAAQEICRQSCGAFERPRSCAQKTQTKNRLEMTSERPASSKPSPAGLSSSTCDWCGKSFAGKTRGAHAKRFCLDSCRNKFNHACRKYGRAEFEAERVTIEQLRQLYSPCTPATSAPGVATLPNSKPKPPS